MPQNLATPLPRINSIRAQPPLPPMRVPFLPGCCQLPVAFAVNRLLASADRGICEWAQNLAQSKTASFDSGEKIHSNSTLEKESSGERGRTRTSNPLIRSPFNDD
jgi:hypothetical protein